MENRPNSIRAFAEKFRTLPVDRLIRLGGTTALLLLVLGLFHVRGNTQDFKAFGHSAIGWMVHRWSGVGGDFSHGWAIPLVSAYLVWRRREELWQAPKAASWFGLAGVVAALLLHVLGYRAQLVRISLLAMISLFFWIPFYLYGRQTARYLFFPCVYLLFCIPLSFLNYLSFPLRVLATKVAANVLNAIGINVVRSGTRIYEVVHAGLGLAGATPAGFQFEVADACSGLRSLIAMMALTAVWAYISQKGWLKKWILFAAGVPLAIAGNIARILTIFVVAAALGQRAAQKVYHDMSGFILFTVAILLMLGLSALLNTRYAEIIAKWRARLLTPYSAPGNSRP
ncbi:MAG: exosortase/archaeosortase family protein [Kiritimatiellae bacterium]|nr:exosortase/archaeosortase family protein [Kiritimatiellia bacterium]